MRLLLTMLLNPCKLTTDAFVVTSASEDSTLAGSAAIPAVTLPSSPALLVRTSARPTYGLSGSTSAGKSEMKMKEKEGREFYMTEGRTRLSCFNLRWRVQWIVRR